ncbi:phospholipase-like protein [Tanacetum coccineum]
MSQLPEIALASNSIQFKEMLSLYFDKENDKDFKRINEMQNMAQELFTNLDPVGVIEDEELFGHLSDEDVVRVCLLLSLEVIFMGRLLVDVVDDSHMRLVENIEEYNVFQWGEYIWRHVYDHILNVESKLNIDMTATISEVQSDWCDSSCLIKEIRLKDNVISQLNTRVFKLKAIIQVLGRQINDVYGVTIFILQYVVSVVPFCRQYQDSDDDVIKVFVKRLKEEVMMRVEKEKLVKYEEEKNKRRLSLMNSDNWKASTSRISNEKRTSVALYDQDMTQFLKDVKDWDDDLSRPNRATVRVHLTDAFDMYLGRRGPLRCRFPWCKDVCVDRRFWESLVCLDPDKKGWIMDEVNYMWHVRLHEADWAMVGAYFVQIILQDSILVWYANGTKYKFAWRDVDQVFMPINETNKHWCLAQLDIQTGVVTFYDSDVTYDH